MLEVGVRVVDTFGNMVHTAWRLIVYSLAEWVKQRVCLLRERGSSEGLLCMQCRSRCETSLGSVFVASTLA